MSITALSQVVQFQFSLRGRILQNVAQYRFNQKKTLDEVLSVLRKLEFIPWPHYWCDLLGYTSFPIHDFIICGEHVTWSE